MSKRSLEKSIHTDLGRDDDYTAYLQLDKLLGAQQPLSDPPHHDEMLFIIQHQVTELWMKLIIHEIEAAIRLMRKDELPPAVKNMARVKHIQNQIYNQWSVLDTLTPSEYVQFRHVFGRASGFQSPQYRLLEFLLGNKNRSYLRVYRQLPEWHDRLVAALNAPSLFEEFLLYLDRHGFELPDEVVRRDFSEQREEHPAVLAAFRVIYENPVDEWRNYEACEALLDIANNFHFWRFHHMKTVERIIGHKRGTGGSTGVAFLRKALDTEIFPELISVRTELGQKRDV
ncbi:MAG: tryptophan 2,3-dioxygenase family protein [Woeseiaceae bacterium]|nr:tryptophan 2,3-dioxygenase family protein [Woeseiaceae bacterium]